MLNTKSAINRIAWRFQEGKAFKPNEKDVDALNKIIEFYNASSSDINYSQEPFAKLYFFLYLNLLRTRQREDQNLKPAKILNQVLESPMIILLSDVLEHLNTYRCDKVLDIVTHEGKAWSEMTDKECKEFRKTKEYKEQLSKVDLQKLVDSQLSYEDLEKTLCSHVNELLENYNGN
jgi:hypothetical protein